MENYLSQANLAHKIVVLPKCGHDMITIESENDDSLNWPANFWRWKRQPQEFADSIVDWIQK
ncbi:hypothetical protein Dfer_1911 [Dyadobacter fermentans DSM 18053]|uniref:Uncharacterized protein n=1 Tax=Dyadobacter fermentans (strain ATCC 700827 / DSM 18053 / CIP 107007 / KCTC 52180 / NS114) TaxID=471854 RepID=C6VW11_DYAFD|nr:hypothetical protein Dfer_1911 [Dyadobacter fermentans DSM 18053]